MVDHGSRASTIRSPEGNNVSTIAAPNGYGNVESLMRSRIWQLGEYAQALVGRYSRFKKNSIA